MVQVCVHRLCGRCRSESESKRIGWNGPERWTDCVIVWNDLPCPRRCGEGTTQEALPENDGPAAEAGAQKSIKASGRYLKARRLAARASQKIRQVNDNWTHQVSRQIADRYAMVYLEDLKTKNMTQSAKGTVAEPGRKVRQKSGLNRSIPKTGWYKLEQALACKTTIHKVAPHYVSQRCNRCGTTDRKNRKTQSEFRCVSGFGLFRLWNNLLGLQQVPCR